ncbi:MAG: MBL fold metallo-hydrolase [Euryarchaeota archaeon]|nr:MBL fold metallo-hydrolase [Euryarchaeota archaeon]
MLSLTVVVDNEAKKGLRAAWGLSVMVEGERKILFDTGPSPEVLAHNLKKLALSNRVDALVLSHLHWDHTGGTSAVEYEVKYVPEADGAGTVSVAPTDILGMAITTGVLGSSIKEQGAIVKGEEKVALLVGCSHPGVEHLTARAVELMGHVDIVLGGFHLLHSTARRVREVASALKELGVKEVYPMHCTGAGAKKILKDELGDRVRSGYAGLRLQL